ncbi:MAG TPA: ATP-binding protein [Candidatus Paceibacterota bacterium]|nr:ATP-binding protein [Candidatus Paceibacterota bacterium]
MNVRVRTYRYALVVVVLALVVGWAGRITWQELRQLHQSFEAVQADAFHLSEHIEASVRDLNETVLRFDLRRAAQDRAAFQQESQELQQWIRAHQPTVTTPLEGELLGQIETAFELYVSLTTQLMDERAQAGSAASPTPVLERVENEAAPILDLCEKLKAAERAAQTQFMKDSHRALGWLQQLLIVQLGLLVILVGTAVVAIYRGVIGPLRVELGESRARAARHEKLASLGTLAAGVAHEIRNPLTAINVRLHSLKKSLAANSSEQEDALVIGHEIQRLERIVQEFLQFARPTEPKLHTVSADSLLARMQSLFGLQLEKTSIRLNLESVPDLWVRVDPHQMEQVLINLVQNAAESMEGGGTITLRSRTGRERLAGRAGPVAILEVSDTGKGIPPEVRKRMFDPFFTTKEEGTGLGLAISSRILEKHGGALECRSDVNRGTTFAILLPHSKPEASNEPAP